MASKIELEHYFEHLTVLTHQCFDYNPTTYVSLYISLDIDEKLCCKMGLRWVFREDFVHITCIVRFVTLLDSF